MQREAVLLAAHTDGADAQLGTRSKHPDRDLAALALGYGAGAGEDDRNQRYRVRADLQDEMNGKRKRGV